MKSRPEDERWLSHLMQAAFDASEKDNAAEDWRGLADELAKLSAEERETLWRCDPRTHRLALGFALLERSENLLTHDPAGARQAAQLLLALLERRTCGDGADARGCGGIAGDLASGAWCVLAQLSLLRLDAEAAAGPLLAADALAEQGTGDPEVAARLLLTRGLMLWVRGQPEDSLSMHLLAARIWREAGEPLQEALVHARRATLFGSLGDEEATRLAWEQAARLCHEAGGKVPESWLQPTAGQGHNETRH
jgi:hypothetical protein